MQIYTNLDQTFLAEPTFLTIGNFDGLHRGHVALLQQLQQLAAQAGGPTPRTGIVTFDPHPLAVLRPNQPLQLLTTPTERLTLAGEWGIDVGVIQHFTSETAKLDARAFMQLLKRHLNMATLVVGPDFALGRNRSGDIPALRKLGEELGYALHVVAPVDWANKPVRSSIVRQALQQGDVAEAADLLGRCYTVTGEVVHGDQRGRQIGLPTANVQAPPDKLLPANGVYATQVYVQMGDKTAVFAGATNLGLRPTVDGLHHRLEAHLLNFPPDGESDNLYGQTLTVEFVARLRGEQRFANLAALVAQIHKDIEQTRQILPTPPLHFP
ncbi:MAG: bifunctional riboflavin kinase/FAD synthetase [Caldilineaceae bacterium]